jgi:ComF family protein
VLRALVLGLKFGGALQAAPLLGRLLAGRVRATGLLEAIPRGAPAVVVPVPLARREFIRRGFNQAEELGRSVARELGLSMEKRLLRKLRSTGIQARMSAAERRVNLKGAFGYSERYAKRWRGATAILVDDVLTTGATADECARTLLAAGLGEVRVAVVGRG